MKTTTLAADTSYRSLDIIIVCAVSILAFIFEGFGQEQGWWEVDPGARGASAVIVGALCAIGLVFLRGGGWRDLGFKRPKNWAWVPLQVLLILLAFLAVQNIVPTVLGLWMDLPEPDFSRHGEVAGNLAAAITLALVLPFTAALPEEIIYRGFLIGRLTEAFGKDLQGATLSVCISAMIFGSIHFQWGLGGMIMTVIMGLVWGVAYLMCDRNLWVVILAHSAGHWLFAWQLYLADSIII